MLENFNFGTVALILAVVVFYLRLVLSSRRRSAQAESTQRVRDASGRKKGSRRKHAGKPARSSPLASFSSSWRNWLIAGVGFVFIALGGLLRQGIIESASWSGYWWVLASIGIVAFSWLFD